MTLFILVEGDDDHRFFRDVLLEPLHARHGEVNDPWKYAEQRIEFRRTLIAGIVANGDEYLYICDQSPGQTIGETKAGVVASIPAIDHARVVVVERMIEGWYVAGLDIAAQKALRIQPGRIPNRTEGIEKGDLDAIRPEGRYRTRAGFLRAMGERYSLTEARGRNRSIDYFCGSFL